jgi:hypothetical protein
MTPDILFANAYHISADRHEQITMRPSDPTNEQEVRPTPLVAAPRPSSSC